MNGQTKTAGAMETTREATVIGALSALLEAWESRDIDAMMAYFAPSPTLMLYGTGADEKRVGLDEVRMQAERDISQSESLSVSLDWNMVGIGGNVAWTASDVTIHFKAPGQPAVEFPARLTTVLQEYDGRWLFEQFHLSVAAANQDEGQSF
ncbi:MAG: nuclear transport factor 2 family protein [Caldilineaceae bacterium]|jgi:ketosteroid isomerase-like protein